MTRSKTDVTSFESLVISLNATMSDLNLNPNPGIATKLNSKLKTDATKAPTIDPVTAYFIEYYPELVHDSSASLSAEFERLAALRGWSKKTMTKKLAKAQVDIYPDFIDRVTKYLTENYPEFVQHPSASLPDEFDRLAAKRGWGEKTKKNKLAKAEADIFTNGNASPPPPNLDDPVAIYLTRRYPGFVHDPRASLPAEFTRLAAKYGWKKAERKATLAKAQVDIFGLYFGTNEADVRTWQKFCKEVGLDVTELTSVTKCKKALKPVLVNIPNLLEHRRNSEVRLIRFGSYGEFCRYTRTHKIPREIAKENKFLRTLLRHLS